MRPEVVVKGGREPEPERWGPRLKVGELVWLAPGGKVHTVLRVNDCAAYVKEGDWTTTGGEPLAGLVGAESISARAFVWREEPPKMEEGEGE